MSELKPKYQLGQYLYQVCPFRETTRCKACDGTGNIEGVDGSFFECPGCNGKGQVYSGYSWAVFWEGTVGQIVLSRVPEGMMLCGFGKEPLIQYRLHRDRWDREGHLAGEEGLFDSLEKAKEECRNRSSVVDDK